MAIAPAFSGNPQISDRTIKIGLVAPLSTAIGQDMDRAARMAIEEINNAGGIYVEEWHANALITLVTADTINDAPDNALPPVRRAILEDKVDLLIGGYQQLRHAACQKEAIDNRVPFIITGASNQLVTRRYLQGNYGVLFQWVMHLELKTLKA